MGRNRDNYPVAAVRHFADAQLLWENDRKDNAMCHYAFSAECVIKAMYGQFCTNHGTDLKHGVKSVLEDMIQYYAALRILDAKSDLILEYAAPPQRLFMRHPGRRYEADLPYTDEELRASHDFTRNELVKQLKQLLLGGGYREIRDRIELWFGDEEGVGADG